LKGFKVAIGARELQNNLLVEIRFRGLGYKHTLKTYDCLTYLCKEELARQEITYRKLEVFFSKYRMTIWLRRGDNDQVCCQQVQEKLTAVVEAFLKQFEKLMPEAWQDATGLVVLYGSMLLPIKMGKLEAESASMIGAQRLALVDTQHYWREMVRCKVLVDNGQREKQIRKLLAEEANRVGGKIITSPILNEVVVTAERPVVNTMEFDRGFLVLPEELILILLENNMAFGLRDSHQLLNTAIFVNNQGGNTPDLNSALAHAREQYDADMEIPVEERQEALKNLSFLRGLGSYYDKQLRMQKIVLTIADQVDAGDTICNVARHASNMAKIDLSTLTCQSLPEFQGHMGSLIARKFGASDAVASAILEHLCPGKYSSKLPHTLVGALLGVADRLDDICGHYHQGEFKLSHHRRVKTWFDEVITILDSVALDISMTRMMKFSLSLYESQRLVPWREKDLDYLLKVFTDRLYCYLVSRDYSENIANALTAVDPDNVFVTMQKAAIMADSVWADELDNCTDVCKLLDRTCCKEYNYEEAAREFLELSEEKDLFEVYLVVKEDIKDDISGRKFADVLTRLAKLKMPMERFLNVVDVDTEDQPLKFNRLSLLAEIRLLYHQFADFSLL
jgi:glycyl-tRNA synthetase beta chain